MPTSRKLQLQLTTGFGEEKESLGKLRYLLTYLGSKSSLFSGDSCSNATTGYKFHLVDEKGNKAEKYGLLIAEAKAGTGVSEHRNK